MNSIAAVNAMFSDKRFEAVFTAVFSVLIFAIFYVLISMNGVVLGNDPAVHLEKAQIFLNTGQISLANLGWTPPLYQIVLAMVISMGGVTDIGQMIFLVRAVAVVCDWLLVFSVYLIASRFFDKRVGLLASALLLMCFPMFEANQFGGYTTILALAFMLLVFLYTPLAVERFNYLAVAFFVAFGLVLSHQLAAFLSFFIMPPILLYMIIKSKGKHLKAVAVIVIGGGVAFFLYYATALFPYLGYIGFVFFGIKTYAYQIPATSLQAYVTNFGFILLLGVAGLIIAGYKLMKDNKPLLTMILLLSFFVPLFFAQSYLFGFYLPFGWFIYYLMPPMVILAAVSAVFFADKAAAYHLNHKAAFKKNWVKLLTVALIIMLASVAVYRSTVVYGRIMEGSAYYSTTDMKAFDAGIWLKENYPPNSTVITTYIPGFWLQEFSGMHVIAQTDPAVQRNEIAEAVLSLSYEFDNIEHTMLRGYEAKGDILDETFVSLDQVWDRVSFSSGSGDFLIYTLNGVQYTVPLSNMSRQTVFEEQAMPKKIVTTFSDDKVVITRTLTLDNSSFSIGTTWTLTPLKSQIYNWSLYTTAIFDLKYRFEQAQIPGLLDWINPWYAPAEIKETHNSTDHRSDWAVANFLSSDLKDRYIGLYDAKNDVAYAVLFNELPDWGNIGSLGNLQIDTVRFQYDFGDLKSNQTVTRSYETLTISKNSYPQLDKNSLQSMFELQPQLTLNARAFTDYLEENKVAFIVYDRNQLDTAMIHSRLLQLVYSNDRYVIFKIAN